LFFDLNTTWPNGGQTMVWRWSHRRMSIYYMGRTPMVETPKEADR